MESGIKGFLKRVFLRKYYIYNTSWWFHIYYKHTKQHKDDLKRVKESVLAVRKRAIGR